MEPRLSFFRSACIPEREAFNAGARLDSTAETIDINTV